ncbi:hypothetical protein C8R45DRAFT_947188 [Mycena sanguinolenta]|nr:hypothetical protein C8R45DRAFT_947188 [Mycena sanguinolenta]
MCDNTTKAPFFLEPYWWLHPLIYLWRLQAVVAFLHVKPVLTSTTYVEGRRRGVGGVAQATAMSGTSRAWEQRRAESSEARWLEHHRRPASSQSGRTSSAAVSEGGGVETKSSLMGTVLWSLDVACVEEATRRGAGGAGQWGMRAHAPSESETRGVVESGVERSESQIRRDGVRAPSQRDTMCANQEGARIVVVRGGHAAHVPMRMSSRQALAGLLSPAILQLICLFNGCGDKMGKLMVLGLCLSSDGPSKLV